MAGRRGFLLAGAVLAGLAVPATAGAATIKVTTNIDERDMVPDENCSLREAVESASQNVPFGGCKAGDTSGLDTIKLANEDYSLTIPATNEAGNANGDLDLGGGGGPVAIVGTSMNGTDVFTTQADRVIEMLEGAKLTLRTLTVGGGDVTSFGTGTGRGGNVEASDGGDLTLHRVRISSGDAYTGGGVYMAAEGKFEAVRSAFSGNHAEGLGAGMDILGDYVAKVKRTTVEDNTTSSGPNSAEGGGISHRATKMTITDSSIVGNSAIGPTDEAAFGGGIRTGVGGALVLRRSLVAENGAAATTDNVFEAGGGVYIGSGAAVPVVIVNTTFYFNEAATPDGIGGAIYVNQGDVQLSNLTFLSNIAGDEGQDIYTQQAAGTILLRNSILEGADPCDGSFNTSLGFNVATVDDPDCGFIASDVPDVLGYGFKTLVPEDNGGFTDTIAIRKVSPARNLVPKAECAYSQGEDQRNFDRPTRKCDSGAFEHAATP